MKKGYYNEKVLAKFADALKAAKAEIAEMLKAGQIPQVKFSAGNSKMGAVASVSSLPFLTCPARCADSCGVSCYAAKIANLYKNTRNAYAWNTAMIILCPAEYHKQVKEYCKGVRFFRYHVSGDIVNKAYFAEMVDNAKENKHCEILAFTKRYEVVNAWISENGDLPENLHILFSGWDNLEPENPHNMPETNVFAHDGEAKESWKVCGGNCFECAVNCAGCWNAKRGDTIAFKLH